MGRRLSYSSRRGSAILKRCASPKLRLIMRTFRTEAVTTSLTPPILPRHATSRETTIDVYYQQNSVQQIFGHSRLSVWKQTFAKHLKVWIRGDLCSTSLQTLSCAIFLSSTRYGKNPKFCWWIMVELLEKFHEKFKLTVCQYTKSLLHWTHFRLTTKSLGVWSESYSHRHFFLLHAVPARQTLQRFLQALPSLGAYFQATTAVFSLILQRFEVCKYHKHLLKVRFSA